MESVPISLVHASRRIRDIADGERAYAPLFGVVVDESGAVWLIPECPIRSRSWAIDLAVITRSGDAYHVRIPKKRYRAIPPPKCDIYIRAASVTMYRRTWWLPWNWVYL